MPEETIISIETLTAAFALWEREYRANPSEFLSAEEAAAVDVPTTAERNAIHFNALLRKVTTA